MSHFIFGGIDTRDYDILVTGTTVYGLPERDYTQVSIPGRNGDIFIDNGRFKNLELTYHCELPGKESLGFNSKFEEFRRKLSSLSGYQLLTDSYEPDITRHGVLTGTVMPVAKGTDWSGGEFEITFSCKPQKFVTSGMSFQHLSTVVKGTLSSSGLIAGTSYNRTGYIDTSGLDSIKISHDYSGSLTVRYICVAQDGAITYATKSVAKNTTVTISIDCEQMMFSWLSGYLTQASARKLHIEVDGYTYHFGDLCIWVNNQGSQTALPILEYKGVTDSENAQAGINVTVSGGGKSTISAIEGHTSTDWYTGFLDCETQSAYNEDGEDISKYVTVYNGEDQTVFSQNYPVLVPGWNMLITWFVDNGTAIPNYDVCIKTNAWTM